MNRRTFFQTAMTAVGALTLFPILASAERRRGGSPAASGPALVNPADSAARAVNYVEDSHNIKDAKLQTDRSGVKFKDQHCKNCAFYQKAQESKVGGKTAAPCQMPFASGKYVVSNGWCTTWAKKS